MLFIYFFFNSHSYRHGINKDWISISRGFKKIIVKNKSTKLFQLKKTKTHEMSHIRKGPKKMNLRVGEEATDYGVCFRKKVLVEAYNF